MDIDPIFLIVFGVVILLSIVLVTFFKNKTKKAEIVSNEPAAPENGQDTGVRRLQVVRNQRARLRANARNFRGADENTEILEEENRPENVVNTEIDKAEFEKMGAKKRAKMEAKAERKIQREMEERAREEKKKKQQAEDEERRKEREKEVEEEKRKEEEERKIREEQERREYEEYLKMKAAFTVDEEGYLEGEADNEENILQLFVKHIKEHKVVILEDLASNFKMKTQSVIDRIQDLQRDGILTGVIDDRGKFIYITEQELQDVAKFIKQRGRISIAELAESSNQLIHLTV